MITFEIYEKYSSIRKSISDVELILGNLKQQTQLEEPQFCYIHLSIYEIFINAIHHGNKMDASKFVEFYAVIEDNKILTVSIIDQGNGFEFCTIPNPLSKENVMKDSGRGIFIASHYADSIDFEQTQRGFSAIITFDLERLKNNIPKTAKKLDNQH